ncbi:hypothetical protein [Paenibacillus glucanolyticus]|uniref:hypothetical protein n=1 Tax=Paenibacillus glucanolyticus TaxID=59843 RepID=UPI00128D2B47|nr:hypothetical protein [Paenibacillus glucanolyticus]MPY20280.1 hypothetical protein [Paenibacillus glucanolyticus]
MIKINNQFPFSCSFPIDLDKDKHGIFYIHFNSFFDSDVFASYRGFSTEGNYIQNVICEMNTNDDRKIEVLWTVEKNDEGILLPIKFSTKKEDDLLILKDKAQEEITNALVSVINAKETTQFFREKYHYFGNPLHGEYYLPGGFRIAPAYTMQEEYIEMDGQKYFNSTHGEHVLYIDHEVSGFNSMHIHEKRKVNSSVYAALISLFLDINLFIPTSEERWVISYDTGERASRKMNLGYADDHLTINRMPKKGTEVSSGALRLVDRTVVEIESTGYHLKCPKDIRKLVRTYSNLNDAEKKKYFNAAKFYQISLDIGRRYPSAGMSYQISAIDILNTKHTAQEYKKLVLQYFPYEIDEEYVMYLYQNVRSAHFHEGIFPGGENQIGAGLNALIQLEKYPNIIRDTKVICKNVLINWLLSKSSE